MTEAPELTATTTINASPAQVWARVTDLPRMAQWSDQVVKTKVLGGEVKQGARFLNLNHQGWKHWPTNGKVVRFEPQRDFAFRITENRTIWSFQLEDAGDGTTTVTHRRETPDGVSGLSRGLTKVVLGGVQGFTDELRAGMQDTLANLKADVEK
ncbi:SRPBCC family protein [Nocardioides panacisoli]|uniref:SRPBCC family protein n=1 Tax=Nocardioides panacisoli TaxID=627624 RepID=UPI001C62C128|nr:SRPBCC family protein [Nocardioides panacisoli]QYJ03299.1 SRPBCC family protein [Nocardioides panacisoli]